MPTIAVIDFTNRFIKLRSDSQRSRRPSSLGNRDTISQQLLNSHDEVAISTEVTPAWVESQKEVEAELGQLASLMSTLQTEQSKDLTSSFGNDRKIRNRIDALTTRITSSFQQLERKIRRISQAPANSSQDVSIIRDNVAKDLAKKLSDLSLSFRQQQKSYLNTLKSF
ncbi:hypothetical protein GEMRC1_002233 [Eukaryota sp. GEM-RC1]